MLFIEKGIPKGTLHMLLHYSTSTYRNPTKARVTKSCAKRVKVKVMHYVIISQPIIVDVNSPSTPPSQMSFYM